MTELKSDNLTNQNITSSAQNKEEADVFSMEEKKYARPASFAGKLSKKLDFLKRVPEVDKIFFAQNLGVMLKSGLSASRALSTLALQTDNSKFKRILLDLFHGVEKGESLASTMRLYPTVFDSIFTNMIKAGEASGQMEEVLSELTRQLKRSHDLKKKVKGALMYPMAILIAMVGIGSIMLIYIIPKMLSIFDELNANLPLPTRILISVSNNFNEHALLYSFSAILMVASLVYAAKRKRGREIWHALILKLPVIKNISKKINLAKISRTLGSMLKTDMPIVQSMNLTGDIVSNVHYKNSIHVIAANLEKGKSISRLMSNYPKLYPPIIQQMIAVGEETGEIASVLTQLAEFYEEDVSQTMDSLPSLIEPVLILVMGAVVGGMAVAIIMPMYSLSEAI